MDQRIQLDIDIARGKVRLPRVALGDLVPGVEGDWWAWVFLPNKHGWARGLKFPIHAGAEEGLRDTLEKLLELHESAP